MAKKKTNTTLVIILIVLLIAGYLMWQKSNNGGGTGGKINPQDIIDSGCYPLEEVHETGALNEMAICLIKENNSGQLIRPPASEFSVGQKIEVKGTSSALDGVYTINDFWIDADGNIGCFYVDNNGGYVFNYNALQNNNPNSPRDITYAGVGKICKLGA